MSNASTLGSLRRCLCCWLAPRMYSAVSISFDLGRSSHHGGAAALPRPLGRRGAARGGGGGPAGGGRAARLPAVGVPSAGSEAERDRQTPPIYSKPKLTALLLLDARPAS